MKTKLTLLLTTACCLLLFPSKASAQWECGFDPILQNEIKNNPSLQKEIEKSNEAWVNYAQAIQQTGKRLTIVNGDTIYEIPVVIHVLHTGGAIGTKYNPSDNTLEDWIDYLNQVYAANYSGYPQAGSGGNALPVKFVLAKRDPNCDSTNGIERIDMSGNSKYVSRGMRVNTNNGLTLAQVTNISQWPTNNYYNLYVINKFDGVDGNCLFCSYVAGFAMLGTTAPLSPYDGAYMLAKTAQAGDITLPHEVGHALGLYHVFQDGSQTSCPPNSNCNTQNDLVCDTDPSRELLGLCPSASSNNPCTSMSYGSNGVQHNIMNYSQCPNHFTAGQAERMMYMLQTYRSDLINSVASLPPENISPIAANCTPSGRVHQINANKQIQVAFDSIDYSYNVNNYYEDATNECSEPIHTTLIAGDTYTLAVTTPTYPLYLKAYIDYNNDGSFSGSGETVMNIHNTISGDTTISVAVVPPSNSVLNTPLRMRVIVDYNNANITPCGQLKFGKAIDFSVSILSGGIPKIATVDFTGQVIAQNEAAFHWNVNNNEQIQAFELQRSIDGRQFQPVSYISKTDNDNQYKTVDYNNGQNLTYFYRLKELCNQGKIIYSQTLKLNFGILESGQVKFFPNPVSKLLTIQSTQPIVQTRITDQSGRVIEILKPNPENRFERQIDFSRLASGLYFIQLVKSDGSIVVQKITKP